MSEDNEDYKHITDYLGNYMNCLYLSILTFNIKIYDYRDMFKQCSLNYMNYIYFSILIDKITIMDNRDIFNQCLLITRITYNNYVSLLIFKIIIFDYRGIFN